MATLQMNILSLRLGMQMNFSVYLPSYVPSKENAEKSYQEIYPRDAKFRTLWLLPSQYGDDRELIENTAILRYAEKAGIAVVFPCPLNRQYSNEYPGQKFLDFITDELWTVCHGTFALSERREDNYIGGISLGAYGALKGAMRNPEKYGGILMVGGACEENLKEGYLAAVNRKIADDGLVPHLPLDDAPEDDAEILPSAMALCYSGSEKPEILISWASEDPLGSYAKNAVKNLSSLGFPVRSKEYPGTEDNWEFRDLALKDAVSAISNP